MKFKSFIKIFTISMVLKFHSSNIFNYDNVYKSFIKVNTPKANKSRYITRKSEITKKQSRL